MARPVTRDEIVDYQTYGDQRPAFRQRIINEVKAPRRIQVGEHLTFLFENHDTVRYQVQEMMRAEQIVKEADILHELETYNELLGDAGSMGATLLIEIVTPEERDELLREWVDLPQHLYALLEDGSKVRPVFDGRQVSDGRLSSVQYLKFETGGKVPVALGSDLPAYAEEHPLDEAQQAALGADLKE